MLSRNNYKEKLRKMTPKKERFSIRKLAVGAASVLIGLTFMGVGSHTVKADTSDDGAKAQANNDDPTHEEKLEGNSTHLDGATTPATDTGKEAVENNSNTDQLAENKTENKTENQVGTDKDQAGTQTLDLSQNAGAKADPKTVSESKIDAKAATQPTYNVDDWTLDSNNAITGYKGAETTDYYIPNSADFRAAKVIGADQQVSIGRDTLQNLVKNATSITVHRAEKGSKDGVLVKGSELSQALQNSSTITSLDLAGLDTSQATGFSNAIYNNPNLESVTGLDTWDTSLVGTDEAIGQGFGHMFADNPKLKTIEGLENWDLKNLRMMDWMFGNDSSLQSLDLSNWNTENVANTSHMFDGATSLTSVGDLSNWNLKNVDNATCMFNNAHKIDNIGNIGGWFPQGSKITTMQQMFNEANSLSSVGDISNWDTSNVTNMGQLFRSNSNLKTIGNLNNWNVSNVTYMAGMFQGIAASTIGDLSNWNTNKVTNMDYMFAYTPNLTSIGNLSATASDGRPGWNNSGALEVAFRMFFHAGVKNIDVSGWKFSSSLSEGNTNSYLGPMTLAKRNIDMFAYLENPATVTINDWPSDVTTNLHASDFDGYQPLIVISNDSNLQKLNSDEITSEQASVVDHKADHVGTKGHVANTVTFVADSDPTKPVASQQQDFVFANEDALNTALNKIPTYDNWKDLAVSNATQLGSVAKEDSGKYLNGKHNATQTPAYEGNYGKIAGTYSVVADTRDITEDLIKGNNYPKDHIKQATYQVVERFPASYKGEGTLTAAEYAKEIGDSDVSKYEGYVYKIIANQTVTAYQTATQNLATGDISYGDYNCKYVTFETTTDKTVDGKKLWDYPKDPNDITYIGDAPVDTPAGYTISAPVNPYITPEKDSKEHAMLTISYNSKDHTFNYDFMVGTSDGNARDRVRFNVLPASYNFYIDYTAQDLGQTIEYVDGDGKVISSQTITGTIGQNVDVTPQIPAGWVLDNDKVPGSVTITDTDTPIKVKIKHGTVVVQPDDPKTPSDKLPNNPDKNYPDGVSKDDLNKTITRTIKITKPDGTVVDKTQTLSFKRIATVDEVTGEVTYGDWTPAKDGSDSFDKVDVPAIPGYTPTQSDVPAMPLTNDEITNWKDTPINISYTPNSQTGFINYVGPDGKIVSSTPISGTTGESVTVNPQAPAGWKIVPGQDIPSSVTAGDSVTVKVEHATTTVTSDNPKTPADGKLPDNPNMNYPDGVSHDDLNKTITRTIEVTDPITGKTTTITQEAKITRTATIDEVTGDVTYSDWSTAEWPEYKIPAVPGYTALVDGKPASVVAGQVVTIDTKAGTVSVTYVKNSSVVPDHNDNNNQNNFPDNNSNSNNGNNSAANNASGNVNHNGALNGNSNVSKQNTSAAKDLNNKRNTLPQTGADKNVAAMLGIMMASVGLALGLAVDKKRKN